jgi:hypothetical protein
MIRYLLNGVTGQKLRTADEAVRVCLEDAERHLKTALAVAINYRDGEQSNLLPPTK